MAKRNKRTFPELPSQADMIRPALRYISDKQSYLAGELKDALALELHVTSDQLKLRHPNPKKTLAFNNLVDFVQAEFTKKGIHTGPNGGKHKNPKDLYYPTAHGLEIARSESRMSDNQVAKLGVPPSNDASTSEETWREAPTDDPELLEERVKAVLSRMDRERGGVLPPPPPGSADVQQVERTTTRFVRDPEVIGWILRRADGACEVCDRLAPFRRSGGDPFLEVHHVRRLADGGPDTVDNTIANCPNCHRELHHGVEREALRAKVIAKTVRLVDHSIRPPGGRLPEVA
jgi:hypothetical protein